MHGEFPIVIVGSGPVGTRVLRDLLRLKPQASVVVYGDEPWEPYDRIKLVSLLSGELAWADLPNLPPFPENHHVVLNYGNRVVAVDRERREVVDSQGNRQPYSKLVLATGSHAWIPDIPGIGLSGIHAFRNVGDVRGLLDKGYAGRRVVVLGGGLLGVELACGLQKKGEQVRIVESGRLLGRQLDDRASELLLKHVKSLGIEVVFGRAKEILGGQNQEGKTAVQAVQTFSGLRIPCDCVVLATGVTPTIDLALGSGLATGRGIKVNDYLQTSDPSIYAVGECAEHRGRVYGLVGPGFEQADIVAQHLLGTRVKYHGSAVSAQLKGTDIAAFSCSREELEDLEDTRSISYESGDKGQYRALRLCKGRLTGVVGIGEWAEAWRIREAVREGRRLTPWQSRSFLASGNLWPEGSSPAVADWPKHATVCNCMGVSRGLLDLAIEQGHTSVEALKTHTKAGMGCGSCVPFLAELVGHPSLPQGVEGGRKLVAASAAALLLLLLAVSIPAWPPLDTLQGGWHIENLWLQGGWKQVSGYSLLTLSCLGLLMSLRKRWSGFEYRTYPAWRVFHVTVGMFALMALLVHTGLAFGHNLDRILAVDFLSLSLLGAATGGLVVLEGRSSANAVVRRLKSCSYWGHVVLFWPLPVLLAFHILSSYYF